MIKKSSGGHKKVEINGNHWGRKIAAGVRHDDSPGLQEDFYLKVSEKEPLLIFYILLYIVDLQVDVITYEWDMNVSMGVLCVREILERWKVDEHTYMCRITKSDSDSTISILYGNLSNYACKQPTRIVGN